MCNSAYVTVWTGGHTEYCDWGSLWKNTGPFYQQRELLMLMTPGEDQQCSWGEAKHKELSRYCFHITKLAGSMRIHLENVK